MCVSSCVSYFKYIYCMCVYSPPSGHHVVSQLHHRMHYCLCHTPFFSTVVSSFNFSHIYSPLYLPLSFPVLGCQSWSSALPSSGHIFTPHFLHLFFFLPYTYAVFFFVQCFFCFPRPIPFSLSLSTIIWFSLRDSFFSTLL